MVDHIENSVDKAAAYVERGRRNVHQAAVYQERARYVMLTACQAEDPTAVACLIWRCSRLV